MKIGVELEFFICHKSDETFYMPDIISRYLKYNSGFISMQKDSNGICIKAKNELGVTISFEFTYSIIEFSIDPQYDNSAFFRLRKGSAAFIFTNSSFFLLKAGLSLLENNFSSL